MTDELRPPLVPPASPASTSVSTQLQRTQPWVRFLSIMGFIASGLMVLLGLVIGAASAAMGRSEMLPVMVMYPIMGALYIFPSLYLLRYADGIKRFLSSNMEPDLAAALDAQRSFWKFAGIWTIVSIGFAAVAFVIAIAVGLLAGITRGRLGA
jgi:hypothetical protein